MPGSGTLSTGSRSHVVPSKSLNELVAVLLSRLHCVTYCVEMLIWLSKVVEGIGASMRVLMSLRWQRVHALLMIQCARGSLYFKLQQPLLFLLLLLQRLRLFDLQLIALNLNI